MKLQSILKSKILHFSALGLFLPFIGIILMTNQQNVSSQQFFPEPTLTPRFYIEATSEVTAELIELYSPAHFGIPDIIGGYPVLAVFTSENTECMPDWELRINLQTPESTLEEYLAGDSGQKIQQAVDALGIPGATISVSGPGSSLETLIGENERWNQSKQEIGCGRVSQPIISNFEVTPLPAIEVYLGTYMPIFFNIPDSIGGYEILAILNEESVVTGCSLPGISRILVRAKRSVDEEYTFGDHTKLLTELQRIRGGQVVLEFVEPLATDDDVARIITSQVQRMASHGCPTLRLGHIITEQPIPTIP